jgi:nucleoside-diphosphate-sugar epimerase
VGQRIAIIGFGAVGRETAWRLAGRGDEVRVVQRRQPEDLPPRAEFLGADVEDSQAMRRACAGVDAVVCGIGLPYDSRVWARVWPKAMANLLDGCAASRARFVFADNLYLYGPQNRPLREDLPLTTYGRKPRIRADLTRQWQSAHQAGKVRAAAVRGADFYGPAAPTSVLTAYGVQRLLEGKPALAPYPPDQPHDFTYVPDFARAIVSIIDAPDDAYGQAWHVPNAPTRTLRDVLELAAALIGVEPRVTRLPSALEPILGLFRREIGELREMRFQWDRPYRVDASKFAARFWTDAMPFEQGLEATIAYYRRASLGATPRRYAPG